MLSETRRAFLESAINDPRLVGDALRLPKVGAGLDFREMPQSARTYLVAGFEQANWALQSLNPTGRRWVVDREGLSASVVPEVLTPSERIQRTESLMDAAIATPSRYRAAVQMAASELRLSETRLSFTSTLSTVQDVEALCRKLGALHHELVGPARFLLLATENVTAEALGISREYASSMLAQRSRVLWLRFEVLRRMAVDSSGGSCALTAWNRWFANDAGGYGVELPTDLEAPERVVGVARIGLPRWREPLEDPLESTIDIPRDAVRAANAAYRALECHGPTFHARLSRLLRVVAGLRGDGFPATAVVPGSAGLSAPRKSMATNGALGRGINQVASGLTPSGALPIVPFADWLTDPRNEVALLVSETDPPSQVAAAVPAVAAVISEADSHSHLAILCRAAGVPMIRQVAHIGTLGRQHTLDSNGSEDE